MAKRRASGADSDPELSNAEETPSKRARVDDDGMEEEETEEQREFEAKYGDKVRASIEAKTKLQGVSPVIARHDMSSETNMLLRESPSLVSSSRLRCTSSCAIHVSLSLSVLKLISSSVIPRSTASVSCSYF